MKGADEPAASGSRPGPAVDAQNRPAVDPTANVLQLVEAAVHRLDDMMEAAVRRLDDLRQADQKRVEDLLSAKAADHQRLDELMDVKVAYIEKMNGQRDLHAIDLREAEANRLNAIRAVDVAAVSQASATATAQASILAGQVAASAETLRTQVSAAATAATNSLAAALEPMQRSIDDLRRAQYEAQGQKTQVVETHARGSANGLWIGLAIAGGGFMLTLLLGVVGIVITLLARGGGS